MSTLIIEGLVLNYVAPSNAYSVGQKYSALDNKIASAADESDVQMIFLVTDALGRRAISR